MINTSGGLTGGDRIEVAATAGTGSHMILTTQAAERAYKSQSGFARVETQLSVAQGARLDWLPQELILFDESAMRRSLSVDLAADARFLMIEPVIFGRAAMGETLTHVTFEDRVRIYRGGTPLYMDGVSLDGDMRPHLERPAIASGAGAMASLVYVAPDAEAHLDAVRDALPETGGASLKKQDVLTMRVIASDGFELRRALLPVLDRLSGDRLPTSWRL